LFQRVPHDAAAISRRVGDFHRFRAIRNARAARAQAARYQTVPIVFIRVLIEAVGWQIDAAARSARCIQGGLIALPNLASGLHSGVWIWFEPSQICNRHAKDSTATTARKQPPAIVKRSDVSESAACRSLEHGMTFFRYLHGWSNWPTIKELSLPCMR